MHTMERSRLFLLLSITVLLLANLLTIAVAAQTNVSTDRSALLALKSHITSDPQSMILSNWSTTTSICNWVGVTCGARHLRVAVLNLSYFGLTGTIPPELGNLSFLVELLLRNNSFHGTLPMELARLRRLKLISLGWNNFMGAIPSWFGSFSKLETFNLFGNRFSGPLPAAIFNLSSLQVINLSYNQLSGIIPPELGNLSFLVHLDFTNNSFHGAIPQELVHLRQLEFLSFQNNNFLGPIPSWFGSLSKLQTFILHGNQFSGSIPTAIFNLSALQAIDLRYNQLSGRIPREIGNLTMLYIIYFDGNTFTEIPDEIGTLDKLEYLFVQENALTGTIPVTIFNMSSLIILTLYRNNLNGSLPDNLCQHLPSIQEFNLGYNQFDGTLPSKLWQCKQLLRLLLFENNFSGSIPRNIGNLTNMQRIYIGRNSLTGTIPHEIGDLPNLEHLVLQENNLNGFIPSTIFNMSTIKIISLTVNQLSGSLPVNLGLGLPNLQELYLAGNYILKGVIPNSISNASKLIMLDLGSNSFSGSIPSELCALTNLQMLDLDTNNLTIDTSTPEANIFSCLPSLRNLISLLWSNNPLDYMFPVSLGNLSTSLEDMRLENCSMRGNIPTDIGNLSSMAILKLGYNQLSGSIPTSIGRLRNLQALHLNDNKLKGYIPDELCELDNLADVLLQGNQLSGSIPSCLDNLAVAIRSLSLGSNLLNSTIPSTLWKLTYILHLNLSSNSLIGSLSEGVGSLKVVIDLDLSNNHLAGTIPSSIGGLQDLVNLSLARNNLEGPIPSSFGNSLSLERLDVSNNTLSGEIPKSLEKLSHLNYLNLSFNRLQGEIPTGGPFRNLSAQSFFSNGELCGASRFHVPPCHRKAGRSILKYIIAGIVSAVLLLSLVLILVIRRKRNIVEVAREATLLPHLLWRKVSYLQLQRATDGFSESSLLGSGGFGSVYKGTLSDGIDVAIKVFNLQLEGAFKSFDIECEMLSKIRHRNLIKVISCCSQTDFKAVVLNYMPNGSLDKWLYSESFSLNILQRLNIMIDAASALEYLHHGHETPIVHCDLKPNNILLDDDMVAHVADFGIAKLLGGGYSMTQTITLATIGYMAPEYGMEGIVTKRGDVYSFGIVLMETFTNKNPTNEMFGGNMSLKQWVANALSADTLLGVVDGNLLGTEEGQAFESKRDCLSSTMRLALACSADSPEERINMQDAQAALKKIKIKFLKDTAEGVLPNPHLVQQTFSTFN